MHCIELALRVQTKKTDIETHNGLTNANKRTLKLWYEGMIFLLICYHGSVPLVMKMDEGT